MNESLSGFPDEASFEARIEAPDVAWFAELSGDRNPLHLDAAYAESTEFGRPIAHGVLLLGLVSRLLGMKIPGRRCLILGMSVRFPNPAYYPINVRVEGTLSAFSPDRGSGVVHVRISQSGTETLLVESRVSFALHSVAGENDVLPERTPAALPTPTPSAYGNDRRRLLVTGGTGGVGKVVVEHLCIAHDVTCLTRGTFAAAGAMTYVTADLDDPLLLADALDNLDPALFHGIVHMSVAAMRKQRLIDDPAELHRQMRHAVSVPVELARWASQKGSNVRRFVLFGSTGGTKQPDVRAGAYALAKASMEPLVSLLSHDLAAQHATVNLVRPGFMPTGLNQGVLARTMLSIAGRAHSGLLVQPSDVAALVTFLLSDAASQINGSVLTIDGGVTPQ